MVLQMKAACWLLCLCLALGLAGCGPAAGPPAKTEKKESKETKVKLSPEALEHLRQGQKLWTEQKLDEALKEFQETARLAPDAPAAHYWLGKLYFSRQEREQSEKAFKQVLQLDPKNYQAMTGLGRLYSFDKDKLDQSQKLLQEALEESPDNLEARFSMGMLHAVKGEQQKALAEFSFIFSKEGEFAIYHFEMGRALETWGDKKQALTHYQRALVINPQYAAADQAVKRLNESLAKEPGGKTAAPLADKTKSPGKKPAK